MGVDIKTVLKYSVGVFIEAMTPYGDVRQMAFAFQRELQFQSSDFVLSLAKWFETQTRKQWRSNTPGKCRESCHSSALIHKRLGVECFFKSAQTEEWTSLLNIRNVLDLKCGRRTLSNSIVDVCGTASIFVQTVQFLQHVQFLWVQSKDLYIRDLCCKFIFQFHVLYLQNLGKARPYSGLQEGAESNA